ncbi:PREDICTED: endogenous retrovirus group K member 21 Gag polyprotein-like [Lepidothrix coronata]|uniref:Endogenous retrovirus group K member 21 Gag polyprotein-like n=1 Tax=Lepidothrix coronata TaxID=321398 RepID=A0A6J0IBK9_9PASS|nr:PREDICTED: endogenous retrovirus group K member 21 Gag polyprotein-like [Lepidothrix coronata]
MKISKNLSKNPSPHPRKRTSPEGPGAVGGRGRPRTADGGREKQSTEYQRHGVSELSDRAGETQESGEHTRRGETACKDFAPLPPAPPPSPPVEAQPAPRPHRPLSLPPLAPAPAHGTAPGSPGPHGSAVYPAAPAAGALTPSVPPPCECICPCPSSAQRSRWTYIKEQASTADDLNLVKAFPVFYHPNNHPVWEPIPLPVLKDTKQAITDYGLNSPYVIRVLGSLFAAYTFTPNDIRDLISAFFTNMQATLFLDEWQTRIRQHAQQTSAITGTPVLESFNRLFGVGPYISNEAQIKIPMNESDISKNLAFQAIQTIAEAAEPTPSYTQVQQKPTEPFIDFAERLKKAIAKQVKHPEAQDALFLKLAIEQSNDDCQQILRTLRDPTPMDMVKACRNVGSNSHKARLIAEALAGPQTCFHCGETGHIKKICPQLTTKTELPKTPCKRCGKGRHWTKDCRSLTNIYGQLLPPKKSPDLRRKVTFNSMPDLKQCTCELSRNTAAPPQPRSILHSPSLQQVPGNHSNPCSSLIT